MVKSKIKAALEMQAIVNDSQSTANKEGKQTFTQKPNLLIIDEIDGVSSGGGSDVSDMKAYGIYDQNFNMVLLDCQRVEFYQGFGEPCHCRGQFQLCQESKR